MDFPTKSQNSWEEIRANPAKARGVCSRTLHYSLDRSVPPPQPTSHSMPKLLALLATIQADDPAGISLVLRDNRIVRWGGPDRSSDKARVLAALLARPGTVFDVSDPDLVYAR